MTDNNNFTLTVKENSVGVEKFLAKLKKYNIKLSFDFNLGAFIIKSDSPALRNQITHFIIEYPEYEKALLEKINQRDIYNWDKTNEDDIFTRWVLYNIVDIFLTPDENLDAQDLEVKNFYSRVIDWLKNNPADDEPPTLAGAVRYHVLHDDKPENFPQ